MSSRNDIGSLADIKVIKSEFDNWVPWNKLAEEQRDSVRSSNRNQPQANRLTTDQEQFLWAVMNNSGNVQSSYARPAELSVKAATKVREQLVALGLLKKQKFQGRKGPPAHLLFPSDKAKEFLKRKK